jgi:BON domain
MRRRPNRVLWLAGGVVAGVAVGWLTAPRRGGWTRNQVRQKLERWMRVGEIRLVKRRRDLENRVRGGVAKVKGAWERHDPYVDANTLVDQVHSQLGREFASALEHVNMNAVGRTIYLHGYVRDAGQRERLVAAIRGVEGVDEVSVQLQDGEKRGMMPPC